MTKERKIIQLLIQWGHNTSTRTWAKRFKNSKDVGIFVHTHTSWTERQDTEMWAFPSLAHNVMENWRNIHHDFYI